MKGEGGDRGGLLMLMMMFGVVVCLFVLSVCSRYIQKVTYEFKKRCRSSFSTVSPL